MKFTIVEREKILYAKCDILEVNKSTVLVTLLRCTVNCTAYPVPALFGPFPQKQGLGLKGLGWRFSNIDGESVEGMKSN